MLRGGGWRRRPQVDDLQADPVLGTLPCGVVSSVGALRTEPCCVEGRSRHARDTKPLLARRSSPDHVPIPGLGVWRNIDPLTP